MRFVVILAMTVSPVVAWGFDFRSPSNNIHCSIWVEDDTTTQAEVRCDRIEYTTSPPRPADCDLDWGSAFWVGHSGRGQAVCAGDTIINPHSMRLQYGGVIELNGIRCMSERTGMTCRNAQGGGFSIARGRADLF
ncbi:DUF6636 domain-containing protein [Paracoccus sp. (in: a-proteobacteria)]|uniref:DUF6636 domain-containing protein n=1 Tax=Paracoccus sp. TaxID=267 RepID=UPI0026E08069|nr:DUF6636 domain-containing protein [Paracoccus sp. (in: a-proteobacteria)]MDO5647093.1 hypothetical protein [Paracoccus sp. (in: a-proteobacteria)]